MDESDAALSPDDADGQSLTAALASDASENDRPSPSVEALIEQIARKMAVQEGRQIVHVERLSPRQAAYALVEPPLPAPLQQALASMGISQLYTHQVEALQRARHGENIVVVTSTSSGKTLCYNLPVIEHILQDRSARAVYIYPINALINDQLKSLFKINLALGKNAVGISRYTGALTGDKRKAARARNPHIWLTNPEMLHLSFLLWHEQWEEFWRSLRFIVIDEVHTYRGVFGSNVAQLMRRILRMAAHYGSFPQFICCSATVANPKELVETLTGCEFSVIDRDGSAKGRRYFILWNPPLESHDGTNIHRSYAEESVKLLCECVRVGYSTILFARARRLTEHMLRISRSLISGQGQSHLLEQISSYRAGYLADEREEIETKLKMGEIRGIITTNALEMGIDIGGLDAAIIAGYPGTIMSTWQQAGRAGRRGRDALIFLVASQNPLDQYYLHHPDKFFAQPHELAVVDLFNQHIGLKHLLCAARELPLTATELSQMAALPRAMVEALRQQGMLVPIVAMDGTETLHCAPSQNEVHLRISLRAAGNEMYRILDENHNEIGTIEPPNVFREAHPGAIYQHGGDTYRVMYLDRRSRTVHVREERAPHYTRASSASTLKVERILGAHTLEVNDMSFGVALGDVLVEEVIYSYQEMDLISGEMVKRVNLTYPLAIRLPTKAMWITFPPTVKDSITRILSCPTDEVKVETEKADEKSPFAQGLHAIEHLLTGVMPLLVMCDRRDIDGYFHSQHPDLQAAAVFIYDAYEGGIGLAEIAYKRVGELLHLAYDTVARCACKDGCPSCIQSGVCRFHNEMLHKGCAETILAAFAAQGLAPANAPETVGTAHDMWPLEDQVSNALRDLLGHARQREETAHPTSEPAALQTGFLPGDKVQHSSYGRGIVIATRKQERNELVTVRFAHRGLIKEIDASKGTLRKAGR